VSQIQKRSTADVAADGHPNSLFGQNAEVASNGWQVPSEVVREAVSRCTTTDCIETIPSWKYTFSFESMNAFFCNTNVASGEDGERRVAMLLRFLLLLENVVDVPLFFLSFSCLISDLEREHGDRMGGYVIAKQLVLRGSQFCRIACRPDQESSSFFSFNVFNNRGDYEQNELASLDVFSTWERSAPPRTVPLNTRLPPGSQTRCMFCEEDLRFRAVP
jgi:hypothetical protein